MCDSDLSHLQMSKRGNDMNLRGKQIEYLIIRKMVCEAGEQELPFVERRQGKTLGEIACATCQPQQVCTQVTRINGPISKDLVLGTLWTLERVLPLCI